MNLHISAPSVFIDSFHKNLVKLNLAENNRILLRSEKPHNQFQTAPLNSKEFKKLTGDTIQYERVFIHQFSPLMYKWVAKNEFNELNWMIWGADLYNLPDLESQFYEPMTRLYIKSQWDTSDFLYKVKLFLTAARYKKAAYTKVDHILTWMNEEFSFAKRKLPLQKATHQFFFYENPTPYQQLVNHESNNSMKAHQLPVFILGNSGSKTNNHLDVLSFLTTHSIRAKLIIPVSYGDKKYVSFLKKNAGLYSLGPIEFVENFMSFDEYVHLLQSADAMIMNTIRPQGYGNIFMMLCMGKPVYVNPKNISLPDLTSQGIQWNSMQDLVNPVLQPNRSSVNAILNLLSAEKLEKTYRELFS